MEIKTIRCRLLPGTTVNAYLIKTAAGFILIDSGMPRHRRKLQKALTEAGCAPGQLDLIILTHGDLDHMGSAAYLREAFQTKIAMHPDDVGMVERGDMFWNRKRPGGLVSMLFNLFFAYPKKTLFTPDLTLEDGDTLNDYGLDAKVLSIPGHSLGSIGVLGADGTLFCGDLLGNTRKPGLWMVIDDEEAAYASVEKLHGLEIDTVYPGHGKAFPMADLQIAKPS